MSAKTKNVMNPPFADVMADYASTILTKTRERGFMWFFRRVLHKLVGIPLYVMYSTVVFILCYPVCRLFNLRFPNVTIRAIGHLCIDVDCYLKEGILGLRPQYNSILLASRKQVANIHMLDYWEKYLKIIRSPFLCALLRPLTEIKSTRYHVYRYSSWIDAKADAYDIQRAYAGRPPLLSLSNSDFTRGWELLNELGIPRDGWFVCVHAREDGYAPNQDQSYRNSDIRDYFPAIRSITERGGWVIRVGDPTMRPIPEMDHVIDYVHLPIRSDWMDTFLAASCRFFFGCTSGLYCVAHVFGRPSVTVNKAPLSFVLPHGPNDIGIPKHVWSIRESRYLGFKELFSTPIGNYRYGEAYQRAAVRVVDNTPEDIQAAVMEMLDRVEGKSVYTEHDEELQRRFKLLMNQTHYSYGSLSRIGRDFMRKYSHLLE